MGSVRTPILGRPRPLPRHRRAHHHARADVPPRLHPGLCVKSRQRAPASRIDELTMSRVLDPALRRRAAHRRTEDQARNRHLAPTNTTTRSTSPGSAPSGKPSATPTRARTSPRDARSPRRSSPHSEPVRSPRSNDSARHSSSGRRHCLAFFDTGRSTNGGAEAVNGLIENHRPRRPRIPQGCDNYSELLMLLIGGGAHPPPPQVGRAVKGCTRIASIDELTMSGVLEAEGIAAGNRVRLRGRVSTAPEERDLPSGTRIVTLRLSVPREGSPMCDGSRQSVDWMDCSAWGGTIRRSAAAWREGDVVEVEGALRRRFYRGAGGTATRLEVELLSGRLVSRGSAPRSSGGGSARAPAG